MFKIENTFSGTFEDDCQEKSVPQSLLTIVAMIFNGSNIKQSDKSLTQAAFSIAQLLLFNSSTRRQARSSAYNHNRNREPPLPVYVGLTIHARTRKREPVWTMFDLGLSISYDRVMAI